MLNTLCTSTTPGHTVYTTAITADRDPPQALTSSGGLATFSEANIDDYDLPLSELGPGVGIYTATFPANAPSGAYLLFHRSRGATPDPLAWDNTLIEGPYYVQWDAANQELRIPTRADRVDNTVTAALAAGSRNSVDVYSVAGVRMAHPSQLMLPAGSSPELSALSTAATVGFAASATLPEGAPSFPAYTATFSGNGGAVAAYTTLATVDISKDFTVEFTYNQVAALAANGDWFGIGFGVEPADPDDGHAPAGLSGYEVGVEPEMRVGLGLAHTGGAPAVTGIGYFGSGLYFGSPMQDGAVAGGTARCSQSPPPAWQSLDLIRVQWFAALQTFVLFVNDEWSFTYEPQVNGDPTDWKLMFGHSCSLGGFYASCGELSVFGVGVTGATDQAAQLAAAASGGGGSDVSIPFTVNDPTPGLNSFVVAAPTLGASAQVTRRGLVFTSGDLQGQVSRILGHDPATGRITLDVDLPVAPANGVAGHIVGLIA